MSLFTLKASNVLFFYAHIAVFLSSVANDVFVCVGNRGDMTLTRGSFTYASGEEYHGEWKEGKTTLLLNLYAAITNLTTAYGY